ncbi:hypothetical protein ACFLX3_02370 [Chloroflexota bacterium]
MTEFLGYFNTGTIDILGFFAGACILSSMILRKMLWIKILLLTGSLCWLTYGIIQHLLPIVAINTIVSSAGIIEVTRLTRMQKSAEIRTG